MNSFQSPSRPGVLKPVWMVCLAVLAAAGWSEAWGGPPLSLPATSQSRLQVAGRAWPGAPGGAAVCLWKDDKLAAFSLTIDDNHAPDHAFWLELGEKYGWKWTWFIITGKVGAGAYWGTWEGFQNLVDRGHDVQSHSVTHLAPGAALPIEKEYADSREAINTHLRNNRCLTLAYPNGNKPPNDSEVAARYFIACRGVRGVLNGRATINYRDVNSVSNASGFLNEESHWASFAGMLNPSNRQKFRGWYCCHFHGLNADLKEQLPRMMDLLKAHEQDVWVGTFREVAQYGQERDTAEVTVTGVTDSEIHFTLRDGVADEYFDLPLTIKVCLDASWPSVDAVQAGHPVEVSLVEHGGRKYAVVQAVPDGGEVILTRR